jgi:hypothetical protein
VKLEGTTLVMLHGTIARLPVGEVCQVDARMEVEGKPPVQGELEVLRINARELALGQWKPRT